MQELSFFSFWRLLILSPKEFFTKHFKSDSSPYFALVFYVCGLSMALERLEGKLEKPNALFSTWGEFWIAALIFGLISGTFYYYFGGWFYNLRVRWSGGSDKPKVSRFLYLYSAFPACLLSIVTAVYGTLNFATPHAYGTAELNLAQFTILTLIAGMLLYTVRISYIGVTTVYDLKEGKAKLWFAILPSIFYGLIFGLIFIGYLVMQFAPELMAV